jgi:hypothetical protein
LMLNIALATQNPSPQRDSRKSNTRIRLQQMIEKQ